MFVALFSESWQLLDHSYLAPIASTLLLELAAVYICLSGTHCPMLSAVGILLFNLTLLLVFLFGGPTAKTLEWYKGK